MCYLVLMTWYHWHRVCQEEIACALMPELRVMEKINDLP